MPIYAIIPTDSNTFIKTLVPIIDAKMDDPNTTFIFSDEHPYIARYLHSRRYRQCILYHLGIKPKHDIGGYKKISGFTSYTEIAYALTLKADEIITIL
jgi:hypothetical protein